MEPHWNDVSWSYGSGDSFTWTQEYLFIAQGYWRKEEQFASWEVPRHRISRIDRSSGLEEILIEDFPHSTVSMDVEGDYLYIRWKDEDQMYLSESEVPPPVYCLQVLDLNGNPISEHKFALEDEASPVFA